MSKKLRTFAIRNNSNLDSIEYQVMKSKTKKKHHEKRRICGPIEWKKTQHITEIQSANNTVQSAKTEENLLSKCKNCTLEEMALLRIVQNNPFVTQKEMAAQMGKSERTVKTITVHLQEKGVLHRRNGKRNGYWEIITDKIANN